MSRSTLQIKLGREAKPLKDASLLRQIHDAHALDSQARDIAKQLKKLKEAILEKARKHLPEEAETITFLGEKMQCQVTFGRSKFIDLPDIPKLKQYLKDTFDVLVQHTDSYRPTKKLLTFAEDKPDVLRLISEKDRSPQIKFSTQEAKK